MDKVQDSEQIRPEAPGPDFRELILPKKNMQCISQSAISVEDPVPTNEAP